MAKEKERGPNLIRQVMLLSTLALIVNFFVNIIRIPIRIISVLCLPFTAIDFILFVSCIVLVYKYQNQCIYCNITHCNLVNIIRTMFSFNTIYIADKNNYISVCYIADTESDLLKTRFNFFNLIIELDQNLNFMGTLKWIPLK